MAEIKREPILFGDRFEILECFDESHTLSDIARWVMKNRVDGEELHRILGEMLNASQS